MVPTRAWEPLPSRGGGVETERVVLARKVSGAWVDLQWTGAEPRGLDDPEIACLLGAQWEGGELVTYDLAALTHQFHHLSDDFICDPD